MYQSHTLDLAEFYVVHLLELPVRVVLAWNNAEGELDGSGRRPKDAIEDTGQVYVRTLKLGGVGSELNQVTLDTPQALRLEVIPVRELTLAALVVLVAEASLDVDAVSGLGGCVLPAVGLSVECASNRLEVLDA